MPEQTNVEPSQVQCPFCGAVAEAGHLFSRVLNWVNGEYGPWRSGLIAVKDQFASLFGGGDRVGTMSTGGDVYLTGIRCRACRRLVLEDNGGLPENAEGATESQRSKS